jgi:hypothetical protein
LESGAIGFKITNELAEEIKGSEYGTDRHIEKWMKRLISGGKRNTEKIPQGSVERTKRGGLGS